MSTDALFCEHWYRVKDLKPRLAKDVVIRRHVYRGIPCYVLHRQANSGYHRANGRTFEIIGKLDGSQTVDELWNLAIQIQGVAAPTQAEFMALLAQLHEAELLTVNRRLNAERLFTRGAEQTSKESRHRYMNPLFLRFRIMDPDRVLTFLLPYMMWLFHRVTAIVWLGLVCVGLFELIPRWAEFRFEIATIQFFSPGYAILFFCAYPILKFLHEFAHGLTVKRLGGEVHELGIALMVLLPIPYIDASAAAILPDKRQRMLVGAAGIIVELGVAAVATIVWSESVGLVHDTALILMLIGGLSTLLFNANPLLKFDGYYILADWIEIPNLAERSKRFLIGHARVRLFGLENDAVAVADSGEKRWLVGYGLLSSVYRTGLMLSIAYMLSAKFYFFGIALSLWVVVTLFGNPLWRYIKFVFAQQRMARSRALLVSAGAAALVVTALGWLPLPFSTLTDAVVWLPENSVVRVASRCDVTEVIAEPGTDVVAGQALFVCEDFELDAEKRVLLSVLDELNAKITGLEAGERVKREVLRNEIKSTQASYTRILEKILKQRVIAEISGRFQVDGGNLLQGRYFDQGTVAAYVVPSGGRTVRLAIEQSDVGMLHESVVRVELQFDEQSGVRQSYESTLVRQTPQAAAKVPSLALTTAGGGRLLADPAGDGTTLLEPVFDIELSWPENAPEVNVGSHVKVKFVHKAAPIANRVLTGVRRAFLGRIDA